MNIQVEPWPYYHSTRGDVYRVKTLPEFYAILKWMWENDVDYLHEFTGHQGYGFSVRKEGPGICNVYVKMGQRMTVTLPYDPTWAPLTWAKEHCPSYITNKASNTTKLKQVAGGWINVCCIVYYFGNEQDVIMFKLRWA